VSTQTRAPAPSSRSSRRVESRRRQRLERSRVTADLLARAHRTDDPSVRQQLLDEVIVVNLGVAQAVAARYRRRGVPADDLEQAAYEGLVKAVHRFDPAQERDLLSYAVPTMRGEVQRHFRDRSWMIRPPRRVQELQYRINQTSEDLTRQLGREPDDSELRDALGVSAEALREAQASFGWFQPMSLDQPAGRSGEAIGDGLAGTAEDDGLEAAEARTTLAPVMGTLSPRDREIVFLRYYEERTQEEIGCALGVTQMQVSRLLTRILRDLRRQLGPA
jgi:RNA polymerase sigma-B factor